jgi:hypothetical protein
MNQIPQPQTESARIVRQVVGQAFEIQLGDIAGAIGSGPGLQGAGAQALAVNRSAQQGRASAIRQQVQIRRMVGEAERFPGRQLDADAVALHLRADFFPGKKIE